MPDVVHVGDVPLRLGALTFPGPGPGLLGPCLAERQALQRWHGVAGPEPGPSRSEKDGSEINKVIVPVLYGPLVVAGYIGYREHVVEPDDTLSAIASTHYGDSSLYQRIVRANVSSSDPDVIFPGQVLHVPIGS